MMTSSNGNIFRVTGPLCGEFTSHRWIPLTKASDEELWCFFYLRLNKRLRKQSRRRWFETPSRLSWRHCNGQGSLSWNTAGEGKVYHCQWCRWILEQNNNNLTDDFCDALIFERKMKYFIQISLQLGNSDLHASSLVFLLFELIFSSH